MRGFTLPPVTKYMMSPKITPPAVDRQKANRPRAMIFKVSAVRKLS